MSRADTPRVNYYIADQCLKNGDKITAMHHLELAAEYRYKPALKLLPNVQFEVAEEFFAKKDVTQALLLYSRAAKGGNAAAIGVLEGFKNYEEEDENVVSEKSTPLLLEEIFEVINGLRWKGVIENEDSEIIGDIVARSFDILNHKEILSVLRAIIDHKIVEFPGDSETCIKLEELIKEKVMQEKAALKEAANNSAKAKRFIIEDGGDDKIEAMEMGLENLYTEEEVAEMEGEEKPPVDVAASSKFSVFDYFRRR